MQEACTIIQNAAHEDANIIFGAVLDEKMKDAVKITVIATGFKDSDMRSRQESRLGFAMPEINYPPQRDYSHREIMPDPELAMVMEAPEHAITEAVSPQPMQQTPQFDQDDLEVPAFLRKRNEM